MIDLSQAIWYSRISYYGGKSRRSVDTDEIRSIMHAFGRQRAAFADDTARFFMDVDLTMAQFRALVAMRRWGRQTGRELARRLRVTPGTLVPMIDRLEELGLRATGARPATTAGRRGSSSRPRPSDLFERLWGMGAARVAGAIAQLIPPTAPSCERLLNQVADRMESNARGAVPRRSTA